MKKKRFFVIMIGLILTIVLILGGCSGEENEEKLVEDEDISSEDEVSTEEEQEHSYDIEIGKEAPNFTLENLDGEEVSLEDHKGKIIMLNFWATWCPYCVKEMPDMNKLQEENDDLLILAVNAKEEKDKVKKYIEEGGYDFEVLLDLEGDVAETYLVGPLPTSYFIDKEGIFIGAVPGMLEYPQMNQIIEIIRENQ